MKKQIIYIGISIVAFTAISLMVFPSSRFYFERKIKTFGYQAQRIENFLPANTFGGWIRQGQETVLSVPVYYQKYSLSCEIAALRMALGYKGIYVSEDNLIKNLPFATYGPRKFDAKKNTNIWADPNVGFVGLINGKMPSTGYGVYEKPILNLARKYLDAKIIEPATLDALIQEISAGNPVVVWGSVSDGKDISWQTPTGETIKAISGEHARVAAGFRGPTEAPTHILLIDPIYGKIQMTTGEFIRDWGLLKNKAVVVY